MSQKRSFIKNLLSYITYKDKKAVKEFSIPEVNENGNTDGNATGQNQVEDKNISVGIQQNMSYLKQKFNAQYNKDIIIREFMIAEKHQAFIAYIEGMADKNIINNFILRPLLKDEKFKGKEEKCQVDFILKSVLEVNLAKKVNTPSEAIDEILSGNTILYVDGCDFYITNETKGIPARGVEKPQIESIVTGAQEAFNESLRTNITLIRKNIKNTNLTTEFLKIGGLNQNLCAIMYIKGIVNPAIVKEVKRRIASIEADYISGDGLLEQFIEDSPYSIVPTMLTTERPDKTAAGIIEGRVAIIAEGTPFSKIIPVTLAALMHSPEDYYMRWPFGTLLRIVRTLGLFASTLLPGLYIAVTNFHQEMIPTELLIAIAKAKENVPFPTLVEVLLMELSFELIREAGIRVPGMIGSTLGIIGALILGQAAVQANIVSPVLIIVVSVTGLGNFALPNHNFALAARLLRFCFIIIGASLGFYGITIGIALLLILLSNIKSFGVPFFTPVAPRVFKSKDQIIRQPVWKRENRPDFLNPLNLIRQPKISRNWTRQEPDNKNNKDDNNV